MRHEPLGALMDAPDGEPGVEVGWTDDARIMFTSGTTGRSKGAIKQHASDYFSGRTYIEVCGVTGEDTVFSCLPLFHSNAQVLAAYPAMIAGARIAFAERYSSAAFWGQVVAAEATILNTVSAINYFIWNTPPGGARPGAPGEPDHGHARPEGHLRALRGALRHPLHRGLRAHRDRDGHLPPAGRPPRPGSCGVATPGLRGERRRAGHRPAAAAWDAGEIVVDMRMPNIVMRAYAGMPEKTAEDFRNLKLHTGDLGRLDEDGYLYFLDRVKDYIRRRGENVSSMEVERVVCAHPDVLEAAAVGVRALEGASAEDEILVCIVARDGRAPDLRDLLAFCDERMPYFAVPRYVRVVASLPKTPTERVRKVELRDAGVTPDTHDRAVHGPPLPSR